MTEYHEDGSVVVSADFPELDQAKIDITLAFDDIDSDDTVALYQRACEILDAIHEDIL